jgi:hypothetical protein
MGKWPPPLDTLAIIGSWLTCCERAAIRFLGTACWAQADKSRQHGMRVLTSACGSKWKAFAFVDLVSI